MKGELGLSFDTFKKIFFPGHYQVQEDGDDVEEKRAFDFRHQLQTNMDQQHILLQKRLLALEQKLKNKFSSCFESVRKAFLELDRDRDGYITIEDLLKYFDNDKELNYYDLKKLMTDKDTLH